jgi:AraC-like DNA-binding protein
MAATATWQMVERTASVPLCDVVRRYTGFTESATSPVRRIEAPRPCLTLIVAFEGTIGISSVDGAALVKSHQAFVTGLGAGPIIAGHGGTLSCIEVELSPLAAPTYFGSASAFREGAVDLRDLWGARAERLTERLATARGWDSRFAVIEEALLACQANARWSVRSELRWAWDRLERSGGRASIGGLAREIGWSDRHFIARFSDAIGETPKRAARRLRFDRARRRIDADPHISFSAVAIDCGYSDQSHLTREFSIFAECSPARYRDARLRDLPGTSADALVR